MELTEFTPALDHALAALEMLRVGIVVQRAGGVIAFCNSEAERILGLSRAQIEGVTSLDPRWRAIHEDGSPFPGETHPGMVTLRTGEPCRDVIMGLHRPDGGLVWISISSTAIPGSGGRAASVVTTFSDVSARIHAEKRYATLFREMLNGFALHEIICDDAGEPADYRFLVVNPAFEKLTGLSADRVTGRTVREVMPGIEPVWIQRYGVVALTGEPTSFEGTAASLGKHFRVTAYSPAPGQFACIFVDETERRSAEELLRVKGAAIASSINGIAIANLDGRLTYVNAAFCRMWGLDASFEVVGRPVLEFWQDPTAAARIATEVVTRGYCVGQLVARRPDGTTFEAEVVTSRVDDEEGRPISLLASFLDVSERTRAERALRESKELLSRFIQHSPIHAYIKDVTPSESRVVMASDSFEQMVGLRGGEMLGRTMGELFPPEFAAKITADDQDVVARGEILTREEELQGRTYTTIKFPIVLGGRRMLAGYTIDITDRKRAEAEVQRVDRLYAALIKINKTIVRVRTPGELFDGVCRILVKTGGFRMAWIGWRNQNSPRVSVRAHHGDDTGYLDEIEIRADDTPEGRGPAGLALREGRSQICNDFQNDPCTLPWRAAAARAGWRAAAAFPIRTGIETPGLLTVYASEEGYFGGQEVALLEETTADLSFALEHLRNEARRASAEEEVRRLSADLERRVEERTAQLEAANRELEAFSYSVSHDLRAPLRAIEGFAGVIVEDGAERLTAADLRHLDVIRANALRMSTLIDDLLKFSRTGRLELRISRVNMESLARSAFEEVVDGPERRQIAGVHIGTLPECEGDPALLRQVWVNLLSNAVKFSSRRERPRIDVTGEWRDGSVAYHVRDNGVGFDMRYASKLFGVFQRLHATSEFEGTGIGLALVKRIVERHGGSVWAEGSVDGGATISFSLPAPPNHEGAVARGSQ